MDVAKNNPKMRISENGNKKGTKEILEEASTAAAPCTRIYD